MRQVTRFCLASLVLLSLCVLCTSSLAQEAQPLQLVQTIPMPNVKGRIDHMDVDVKGQRLFVAGLENGSVEVTQNVIQIVDAEIEKVQGELAKIAKETEDETKK